MIETYETLKHSCYEALGKPERGSQDEQVLVAAVIVGILQALNASASAFYDEEGELRGFTVDGVNFFLETRKEELRA